MQMGDDIGLVGNIKPVMSPNHHMSSERIPLGRYDVDNYKASPIVRQDYTGSFERSYCNAAEYPTYVVCAGHFVSCPYLNSLGILSGRFSVAQEYCLRPTTLISSIWLQSSDHRVFY